MKIILLKLSTLYSYTCVVELIECHKLLFFFPFIIPFGHAVSHENNSSEIKILYISIHVPFD